VKKSDREKEERILGCSEKKSANDGFNFVSTCLWVVVSASNGQCEWSILFHEFGRNGILYL
jgi:hypothetical protein